MNSNCHLVAVVPGLDDHVLAGDGAAERGGRGAVRGRHELGLLALGAPIGARVPRLVEGSGLHTYTLHTTRHISIVSDTWIMESLLLGQKKTLLCAFSE